MKFPNFRIERGTLEKPVKSPSHVVLEVLVNSAGTICEVRALKAPDRETARQMAETCQTIFASVQRPGGNCGGGPGESADVEPVRVCGREPAEQH